MIDQLKDYDVDQEIKEAFDKGVTSGLIFGTIAGVFLTLIAHLIFIHFYK